MWINKTPYTYLYQCVSAILCFVTSLFDFEHNSLFLILKMMHRFFVGFENFYFNIFSINIYMDYICDRTYLEMLLYSFIIYNEMILPFMKVQSLKKHICKIYSKSEILYLYCVMPQHVSLHKSTVDKQTIELFTRERNY